VPIGVPKVPFRLPGEEDTTWVDLYNVMYRSRIIFLVQELQDEIANQVIGIMTYIHMEGEPNLPAYMFINSPGGSLFAGFAVYDTMHGIEPPVHTICAGVAASMASVIFTGGEPSHRLMMPHSRLMIHQPAIVYFDGQATDCAFEASVMLRLRNHVTQVYRQRTARSPLSIYHDLERDSFFTAEEAVKYGMADGIVDDQIKEMRPLSDWEIFENKLEAETERLNKLLEAKKNLRSRIPIKASDKV